MLVKFAGRDVWAAKLAMKLERRPRIFRALHLRPFCLKAAQSLRFFVTMPNQNFSVIQLKPKPTIVSPSSATQNPEESCDRQNSGKAVGGGASQGCLPWRTQRVTRLLNDALGFRQIFRLRRAIGNVH